MRKQVDSLRRTICSGDVCKPRSASEEDCEDGEVMKRVLKVIAGTFVTAVAMLFVYFYYLLRVNSGNTQNNADNIYTR